MDTSGFYKLDSTGELLYAANEVHTKSGSLIRKNFSTYIYPALGGWSWYDTKELAMQANGITLSTFEEQLVAKNLQDDPKLVEIVTQLNQLTKEFNQQVADKTVTTKLVKK